VGVRVVRTDADPRQEMHYPRTSEEIEIGERVLIAHELDDRRLFRRRCSRPRQDGDLRRAPFVAPVNSPDSATAVLAPCTGFSKPDLKSLPNRRHGGIFQFDISGDLGSPFYTTPSIVRRVWNSRRTAKPPAAAARCLSVCPLTIEPAENTFSSKNSNNFASA
jgi:hypothetical protein